MFKALLITYGEIGIKGQNRYIFEDALIKQIKYALKDADAFEVTKQQGRIYVHMLEDYDYDQVVGALTRVFGIVAICPVVICDDPSWDNLTRVVGDYMDKAYEDKKFTFKVDSRRADKRYPKKSMEINADIGEYLLELFPEMSVDVHHPYTSERAKQKVVDLARIVARYSGPVKLNIINFTDIQLAIYEKCPHDELTIIMRRYMMKIAERIAREDGALGLITGESIGQVASQTLQSLAATNAVCTMPVFRPVIGFDKNDIVEISEKIGAFETSIQPFEDCCTIFVAKHPVTKPNIRVIERSEHHLADSIDAMMDEAVNSREVILCEADA